MSEEVMTPAELRMSELLHQIAPDDKSFRTLIGLTCIEEGLVEELVEYIETNHVTDPNEVYVWLYGEDDENDDEDGTSE